MNSSPRNPPRFLPTLTEVVHAPDLGVMPAPKTPDAADIVRMVLQTVEPVVARRLGDEAEAMVRTLVNEQMGLLQARLQQEMALVVRQVVSETLTSLRENRLI